MSCDRYVWNWFVGIKLVGREFELFFFIFVVDEFFLNFDVGIGDFEGFGDFGVIRDWDLLIWLRGDIWEFFVFKECCVVFVVFVVDFWSFNK